MKRNTKILLNDITGIEVICQVVIKKNIRPELNNQMIKIEEQYITLLYNTWYLCKIDIRIKETMSEPICAEVSVYDDMFLDTHGDVLNIEYDKNRLEQELKRYINMII